MKNKILIKPGVFNYQIKSICSLAKNVAQIFLTPESSRIHYEAGQYVHVIHADQSFSPLSIACTPNLNGELEFHLYHSSENKKANDLLHMARDKKIWQIAGPYGTRTISILQPDLTIIFLAKGTGFASIKAIIEEKITTMKNKFSADLFWSIPKACDFYLLNLIENWKSQCKDFTFTPLFTKEASYTLSQAISAAYSNLSHCQVYASGSLTFVDSAFNGLKKQGLKKEFFYSDLLQQFPPVK
jgi:NAD(P)H-flavin reductase